MTNFDILNIGHEEIPPLSDDIMELLERGKTEPVQVLDGVSAERFKGQKPYAQTNVSIDFDDENDLINCVRLLRWSDERLAAMGSTIRWNWEITSRCKMNIKFAVSWHDKDFFDEKKEAFKDKGHISYFQMFGKNVDEMTVETVILAN